MNKIFGTHPIQCTSIRTVSRAPGNFQTQGTSKLWRIGIKKIDFKLKHTKDLLRPQATIFSLYLLNETQMPVDADIFNYLLQYYLSLADSNTATTLHALVATQPNTYISLIKITTQEV